MHPIFRGSYTIGEGAIEEKIYVISESCTCCGICAENCPQSCISSGTPYRIEQHNCLRCGLCQEKCQVSAIEYRCAVL